MNSDIEKIISESSCQLLPIEDTVQYGFDPKTMQWVNFETETYYDKDGNVVSSKSTYYHKPDAELYRIFPDIVLENLTSIEACEECVKCSGAKEKPDDKDDQDSPDEFSVLHLTPKGIALVAASISGMIDGIDDERFENFWKIFEEKMKKNGYIEG